MTLAEALHQGHTRWPDRIAITYKETATSYRELCSAVAAVADAYGEIGIQPGDRVICALTNCPEFVIAALAAWTLGAIHVGVDSDIPLAECRRIAHSTGAKAILHSQSLTLELLEADGSQAGQYALGDWLSELRPSHRICAPKAPADALATLFLTSGTTGRPKFPVSYQRTLAERWGRIARQLEHGPDDVHLAHLPLSHGFGLMMCLTALLTGGRLVFPSSTSVDDALGLIPKERVTVVSGSPVLYKLMVDRRDRFDLRTIRIAIGSAAPFALPLLRQVIDDLGLRFMLMYGASEGVGVATTDRDEILGGSVGKPQPGAVAIIGPDLQPVPTGCIGEIAFSRSTNPVLYWDSVSASPRSGEGQWFRSGDLGRLDADGLLYVIGRLAYQINRAGLKIDPAAIEAAILDTGRASDVAVVGVPDPILGEVACACVVLEAGQDSTLALLRNELSRALGASRCPDHVVTLAQIPRTGVGKVKYADLKAKIMFELRL